MARQKRRSADSETIYSSGVRLVQKRFPSRLRVARPRDLPTNSAPTKKKRQSTLTQIDFVRNSTDSDYLDEELFGHPLKEGDSEGLNVEGGAAGKEGKPTKKRRRTTVQDEDGFECSPDKRRRRRGSITNTRRDQQTLTQGGYLRTCHDARSDEDASFDIWEDAAPHREAVRSQQGSETHDLDEQAVIIPPTSLRRSTRAHSKTKTAGSHSVGASDKKLIRSPQKPKNAKLQQVYVDRDPASLQTPNTTRTREVPSSQSPAESILSTQSPRGSDQQHKSPLKERSTNMMLRSPRKASASLKEKLVGTRSTSPKWKTIEKSNPFPKPGTWKRTHTIHDSDDEEDPQPASPGKDVARPVAISASQRDPEHDSDVGSDGQMTSSPQQAQFGGLPQPNWNRLEERKVTQHLTFIQDIAEDEGEDNAEDAPSQISISDGPSAQILNEIHLASQRNIHSAALGFDCGPRSRIAAQLGAVASQGTALVRPSQATTVDITQATPQTQMQSRQISGSLKHPAQSSSPPTSSSPAAANQPKFPADRVDQQAQEIVIPSSLESEELLPPGSAEVRRVTFSQLVPESLRTDSYPTQHCMPWMEDEEL